MEHILTLVTKLDKEPIVGYNLFMLENKTNYQQVIEAVVTNGRGFKDGSGTFSARPVPETTISILEQLASMDHHGGACKAIVWARDQFLLGLDQKLSPKSFNTARSLISIYEAAKDLSDRLMQQAYNSGYNLGHRVGYSEGYQAGEVLGPIFQKLSRKSGMNFLTPQDKSSLLIPKIPGGEKLIEPTLLKKENSGKF